MDAHDTFTLSFFDEGWRKQLAYLGSVSGRDEDKVAKAGLTPAFDQAGPYFEEASLVFVCRKAYVQAFEEPCFVDRSQLDRLVPRTRPAHDVRRPRGEDAGESNRAPKKGARKRSVSGPLATHAFATRHAFGW